MRLGFAKSDLTPRVGVELCGFGPFINRHSIAVRDRLWARAMAVEVGEKRAVVISNDLCLVEQNTTARIRELIGEATGLPPEAIALEVDVTSVVLSAASSVGLAVRDVRPGLLADSISVLSADDKYAVEVIVKSLSTSVSVVDDVVDDPDRPSS